MKKFFYLVAIATLMMTSCSKSDEIINEGNGQEDLQIKFGSTTMSVDVAGTRAPVDAQAAIAGLQLVRVADYTASADWNAASVNIATTATAAWNSTNSKYDLTVTTPQYYNADPDFYSAFTAYAPAATFAAGNGTTTFPTAQWTIDGKTDILVSSASAAGTKATTIPLNFSLQHALLQLRFFLVADAAAQTAWGAVTGIEILNSSNSAIATLPAATMNFPASATPATDLSDIPVYAYGTDNVLADANKVALPTTATANEQAYVMLAPNTVDNNKQFKIKVYTEKSNTDGVELTVTLADAPVAGDSYAVTLTFRATLIEFTATLTDWVTTGKTGTGTVE